MTGDLGLLFSFARTNDVFGTRDFRLIGLPLGITRDRRDDRLDPRGGSFVAAELMPFRGFGGTASGARFTLDARAYRPLGDRLTLALRAQAGALGGADLSEAPPDYLFFSGGGGTVRGQPYQALDVAVPGGRTGGRGFAALSVEARARLTDTLGLVAFADAGLIAADPGLSSGDWHAGAGLGLRYSTPLGPLRLDVAGPVAGTTGDGFQVYIGIGQAF